MYLFKLFSTSETSGQKILKHSREKKILHEMLLRITLKLLTAFFFKSAL